MNFMTTSVMSLAMLTATACGDHQTSNTMVSDVGLGFGIDFHIPYISPNMEQNNPLLPQCDVKELTRSQTKVECRQGWLRGISPDSIEVKFPGLTADSTVTFVDRWSNKSVVTHGEVPATISVGERSYYQVEVNRGVGVEPVSFELSVYFYPVAP